MDAAKGTNYRKSMSFGPVKDGSFILPSFNKQHKKSNSDNETASELKALRDNKFLAQRPSQEDLYQRNILPNAPYAAQYPPLPPKLSIFFKIQKAFELAQGSQCEGIFRISGNTGNIGKVWNSIAAEAPNFQGVTPHDIAGVMKLYIRQLQIPLVPIELFQYFVDAQRIDDVAQRIIGMRQLLRCIPEDNLLLLRALIIFLERVASHSGVNKMTPHNLAVCFGPNVLRSPKDGAEVLNDIEVQCSVVTTMISHRVEIFGETSTGHREERAHTIGGAPPPFISQNSAPDLKQNSALSNLPPPPPSPLNNTPHSSNSFLVLSPTTPSPAVTAAASTHQSRKTIGTGKPPVLTPPPSLSPSDLPPPPPLTLPPPLITPPPSLFTPPPSLVTPNSSTLPPPLPPPPPLVSPKPAKKHPEPPPMEDDSLDAQDEELYLSLIDDLDETDKDTLVKKLAAYFAADAEGFRRFLKGAVGADGVIALLELLVL